MPRSSTTMKVLLRTSPKQNSAWSKLVGTVGKQAAQVRLKIESEKSYKLESKVQWTTATNVAKRTKEGECLPQKTAAKTWFVFDSAAHFRPPPNHQLVLGRYEAQEVSSFLSQNQQNQVGQPALYELAVHTDEQGTPRLELRLHGQRPPRAAEEDTNTKEAMIEEGGDDEVERRRVEEVQAESPQVHTQSASVPNSPSETPESPFVCHVTMRKKKQGESRSAPPPKETHESSPVCHVTMRKRKQGEGRSALPPKKSLMGPAQWSAKKRSGEVDAESEPAPKLTAEDNTVKDQKVSLADQVEEPTQDQEEERSSGSSSSSSSAEDQKVSLADQVEEPTQDQEEEIFRIVIELLISGNFPFSAIEINHSLHSAEDQKVSLADQVEEPTQDQEEERSSGSSSSSSSAEDQKVSLADQVEEPTQDQEEERSSGSSSSSSSAEDQKVSLADQVEEPTQDQEEERSSGSSSSSSSAEPWSEELQDVYELFELEAMEEFVEETGSSNSSDSFFLTQRDRERIALAYARANLVEVSDDEDEPAEVPRAEDSETIAAEDAQIDAVQTSSLQGEDVPEAEEMRDEMEAVEDEAEERDEKDEEEVVEEEKAVDQAGPAAQPAAAPQQAAAGVAGTGQTQKLPAGQRPRPVAQRASRRLRGLDVGQAVRRVPPALAGLSPAQLLLKIREELEAKLRDGGSGDEELRKVGRLSSAKTSLEAIQKGRHVTGVQMARILRKIEGGY
ncbi:unnamed protein product [Caenorhabditis auriculariae]|uniref:Uncharacterized protein n=1 Tax=Caenorhabditis auriculariae TaxID=2777116 RepID=A0A8S1HQ88_9PELO|nr:unnamed protein product [Caenorhabditis auriculariae]